MSDVRHWDALTRDEVSAVAADALLVLPVGTTEQHGPHLATGTDAALVQAVAERAAALAARPEVVLLAPMRKQQKKQKELLAALKKGDRVVTSGGIHGTIAQVEDQIVWLKVTDTVKIKVNRSAIAGASGESDSKESAA